MKLDIILSQGTGDGYCCIALKNSEFPNLVNLRDSTSEGLLGFLFLCANVHLFGSERKDGYRVPDGDMCDFRRPLVLAKKLKNAVQKNHPDWLTSIFGCRGSEISKYIQASGTTDNTLKVFLSDKVWIRFVIEPSESISKPSFALSTASDDQVRKALEYIVLLLKKRRCRLDVEVFGFPERSSERLMIEDASKDPLRFGEQISVIFRSNQKVHPYLFFLEPEGVLEIYPVLDKRLGDISEVPVRKRIGMNAMDIRIPDSSGFPVEKTTGNEVILLVVCRTELQEANKEKLRQELFRVLGVHLLSKQLPMPTTTMIGKELHGSLTRAGRYQGVSEWPRLFMDELDPEGEQFLEAQIIVIPVSGS